MSLPWWTGTWETGRRDIAEAIELAGLVGQESLLSFAWCLLANYAAAAGHGDEFDEALVHAGRAEKESGTTPARIYAARARLHAALAQNRAEDAITYGAHAHAAARQVGLAGLMQVPYLPEYVEAAILSGNSDTSRLLDELRERANMEQSQWARSTVARLDGMSCGDSDEARTHFTLALELVSAEHMPFEHARTMHRHGERELGDGRDRRGTAAAKPLDRAYTPSSAPGPGGTRPQPPCVAPAVGQPDPLDIPTHSRRNKNASLTSSHAG